MRKTAILFLLLLVSLTSCDIFMQKEMKIEPKLYMLALGVSYEHTDKIRNLKYTKADMEAVCAQIENLISGRMDYEILSYEDEEEGFVLSRITERGKEKMKTLSDNIDQIEFFDAITSSFSTLPEENDIFILYYAGHGDNGHGGLVYTYDYEGLGYKSITVRDIYDDLLSLFNSRKLMILDSCYSGNFIEEGDLANIKRYDENHELISFNLVDSIALSMKSVRNGSSAKPSTYVLSGAGSDQMTYERDDVKHGLFTYALLSYLGYDLDNEEAVYTTGFDGETISVYDLYRGVLEHFPDDAYKRKSTPSITPARYDMVIFDFR